LLLEELKGTPYEEDLKVITEETLRCRKIVRGLLDFARDYKPEKVSVNLNTLIEQTLQILENHVSFQNIKIVKTLIRIYLRLELMLTNSGQLSIIWPLMPLMLCPRAVS